METKNNIVEFYSGEFKNAIDNGFTKNEAKDIAKDAMNNKFPETKEWGFNQQKEWGLIANAVQKVLKQYKPAKIIDVTETVQMPVIRHTNYMQAYREFCDDGFLPKNLEPLIGFKKQKQLTSYKNFLENEGYVFQEQEYGWVVVGKPDPRKVEIKKMIDDLNSKINGLRSELEGLA